MRHEKEKGKTSLLSVVIITFNEAKRIEKCLQSVQSLADEIVVVDSFSTDATRQICESYGARFIQRKWTNFGDAKRFAVQAASYDYVLSLDADEVLSEMLKTSIQNAKNNWFADAYKFNRLNFVGNQAIRHGGWYPDCKIRLFDRRKANWTEAHVHEIVVPVVNNCIVAFLSGDLLHYSFDSIESLLNSSKTKLFIGMYARKKKLPKLVVFLKSLFSFTKSYLLQRGFLDGKAGWAVAMSRMKYTHIKYS
jgi:glycosyltransferase involved in cell wall biosynthesis